MRLRIYIAIFSFLILALVLSISFSFLRKSVADAFGSIAQSEERQIQKVADAFVEIQKKKLENINRLMSDNSDLANTFLLSRETHDESLLQTKLKEFKDRSGLDFIEIERDKSKESKFVIENFKSKPALLILSPLYLYGESIGRIRAGHFLDGTFLNDIREITGQNLRLEVENGQLRYKGFTPSFRLNDEQSALLPKMMLSLLGAFVILYLLIFIFFDLGFMAAFREILSKLRASAARLKEGSIYPYDASQNFIRELNELDVSVIQLHQALVQYQDQLGKGHREQQEIEKKVALAELASQVVHDIRTPVASLNIILNAMQNIDEEERDLIGRSIRRISEIADDLLKKRKQLKEEVESQIEPILLSHLLENSIGEMKLRLSDTVIQIRLDIDENARMGFVLGEEPVLKRVIANLLNNSREAMKDESGKIEIKLQKCDDTLQLQITDTGPGIPSEILPKIFEMGFTFNKEGGSGLGLFHAKQSVERWGAKLEIESTIGVGTTVIIHFKLADRPSWLMPRLHLAPHKKIAVLDDKESFLDAWKACLQEKGYDLDVDYFQSAKSFEEALSKGSHRYDYYFIDYDLGERGVKGTHLIEKFQIQNKSVIVTGREIDNDLIREIGKLGTSLLPKQLLSTVLIPNEEAGGVYRPSNPG